MESRPQAVIGVDTGGTNIKVALVDPARQRLLKRVQLKTQPQRGFRLIVADLRNDITKLGFLADAGDEMAQELFHLVGTSLAIAIANVVHLLGIRSVLISGGVAKGWEAFISSLEGELKRRLTLIPPDEVNVVRAQMGDDAGPLGGGYLAAKSTRII